MFKLAMTIVVSVILLTPNFAKSMLEMSRIAKAERDGNSEIMFQTRQQHALAVSGESSGFVKHWWNVPCAVTDRKGRGGTFERVFRVCANFATTARVAANNDCEKQYSQQYGWNCCTCKGTPEDTGSSCNN
jgi:hypothetical protein